MGDLISDLTSFHWWLGVVVVGILINLASDYLKPRADTILGSLSTWYATRTEKRRVGRQDRIDQYLNDREYRIYLYHLENSAKITSMALMICSFAADAAAVCFADRYATYRTSDFVMFFVVMVFFAGAVSMILSARQALTAMGYRNEIAEAREILNERNSRRTRSANNA